MTNAYGIVRAYCGTKGYPLPDPEYRFAPPRRWRFDAAWVPLKIAVEFQGGNWTGGRHTRGKGFENDCEKLATAASLGWRVLPVTYRQVEDGRLFGLLDRVLS